MECTKYLNMISTYVDEEAPSLERQALEKHFASCPSCRAELTKQLALKDMIKTSFERTVDVDMSRDIMSMIRQQQPKTVVKKVSFMKKISVFAAAAAAVFVLAMAAVMTLGTEDTQIAGNEKLEEYVIEHVGAGVIDFNGELATVNLEK
ncbi:MAG: anti-sigma factor [Deferribacterales bacterium]